MKQWLNYGIEYNVQQIVMRQKDSEKLGQTFEWIPL